MQTFLPFPDFAESAKCLDNRRLGKQRVEAKQILRINLLKSAPFVHSCAICGKVYFLDEEIPVDCMRGIEHRYPDEVKIPWENHPAVLMWRGCELAIAYYGFVICKEWISRGFKDNQLKFFGDYCHKSLHEFQPNINFWKGEDDYIDYPDEGTFASNNFYLFCEFPDWMGNSNLHFSHQANLLRKDYNHYSKYFNIPNYEEIPYYWPVNKEKK